MSRFFRLCCLLCTFVCVYRLIADEPKAATPAAQQAEEPAAETPEEPAPLEIPDKPAPDKQDANLRRLGADVDVWLDNKNKKIVMEGHVCLRRGQLEMFACPRKTKEHESIISIRTSAQTVHAGLLALGAKPGNTVKFDPKYVPASGTEIKVLLTWKDKAGKEHSARAQEWVKDVGTMKAMEYPWVFAGSGFWRDEMTGKRTYMADAGDFICVSNFSSAMLDIPVKSTDMADQGLQFVAFEEKIPPKGTPVTVTLVPKLEKKGETKEQSKEKPAGK